MIWVIKLPFTKVGEDHELGGKAERLIVVCFLLEPRILLIASFFELFLAILDPVVEASGR